MISFNVPPVAGKELIYLEEAIRSKKYAEMGHLRNGVPDGWKNRREVREFF